MADPQARATFRRSLRASLLLRVLLPLAATWSIGSAAAFSLSWVLAGRAFDRALLDDAYVIAANVVERDGALILSLSPREVDNVLFDREDKQYFSIAETSGRVVASNADLSAAGAAALRAGTFSNATLKGEALRLAALRSEGARPFVVVVGQTTVSRNRFLTGLLERSLLPQVVLLLLLGIYLWRQISRELTPLGELQRALERRHSSDLEPIAGNPGSSDVERLREAVNSLLARVGRGVQAQREFAGNVAHDLRTPLAGIRALAAYGLAHDEPAVWRRQLESIAQSEERASRLVDQLLALALADEARDSVGLEPTRIDEIARRVLLSFVARADAAHVDLEAEGLDARHARPRLAGAGGRDPHQPDRQRAALRQRRCPSDLDPRRRAPRARSPHHGDRYRPGPRFRPARARQAALGAGQRRAAGRRAGAGSGSRRPRVARDRHAAGGDGGDSVMTRRPRRSRWFSSPPDRR